MLFWQFVANESENRWMEKKIPMSKQSNIISGCTWLEKLTTAAQDSRCPRIALLL